MYKPVYKAVDKFRFKMKQMDRTRYNVRYRVARGIVSIRWACDIACCGAFGAYS